MAAKQAFLMAFGCAVAVLALLAALAIVGSLLVAAILPRGNSLGDQLRTFASQVPSLAAHGAMWVRMLIVVGGIGLLVVSVLMTDPAFHF